MVTAAVAILRAEGLRKVTMRRLAQELDTGPASLYVYVANTDELHAAVLDELLGKVDLRPIRAGGDWRDRLIEILLSYTTVLFEHAGLARSALVARPSGAHYLELAESLLALLDEGGVPPAQAAWGLDVLLQLATATVAEHSGDAPVTEADWNKLTQAIQHASPAHPHIAALGADLLSGTPEERLGWAFRVVINGIAYTPRSTP
ncbi:TetR/AcrR family transcriptional regulator [Amycolatopsis alkalitolerans]|uniref:TetR/AcrR family transcriptional regulator n=1 Tax=Amycolatopsis alkalitolerans TaxID=2547244 RepID=A0A5C4LP50_9PSEU|nr:TetR/AcrR family transcriptional regulator [Amycolatopsis alkalitolerans]